MKRNTHTRTQKHELARARARAHTHTHTHSARLFCLLRKEGGSVNQKFCKASDGLMDKINFSKGTSVSYFMLSSR